VHCPHQLQTTALSTLFFEHLSFTPSTEPQTGQNSVQAVVATLISPSRSTPKPTNSKKKTDTKQTPKQTYPINASTNPPSPHPGALETQRMERSLFEYATGNSTSIHHTSSVSTAVKNTHTKKTLFGLKLFLIMSRHSKDPPNQTFGFRPAAVK
jgi:hypothetical protein